MLLGAPLGDAAQHYTNSALGLSPDAHAGAPALPYDYRYDKHHLVPFGEFIPFGFRWFVDMMHIPLGDFTRGAVLQPPFAVGDQRVLPNICYEDVFGEEIAAQLAAGHASNSAATLLLNMSNIAWFGDTIALPQHLQISQTARAGNRAADAARHQHRRHRHHRPPRPRQRAVAAFHARHAGGDGAGHQRRHAVHPLRQPAAAGADCAGAGRGLALQPTFASRRSAAQSAPGPG